MNIEVQGDALVLQTDERQRGRSLLSVLEQATCNSREDT